MLLQSVAIVAKKSWVAGKITGFVKEICIVIFLLKHVNSWLKFWSHFGVI